MNTNIWPHERQQILFSLCMYHIICSQYIQLYVGIYCVTHQILTQYLTFGSKIVDIFPYIFIFPRKFVSIVWWFRAHLTVVRNESPTDCLIFKISIRQWGRKIKAKNEWFGIKNKKGYYLPDDMFDDKIFWVHDVCQELYKKRTVHYTL